MPEIITFHPHAREGAGFLPAIFLQSDPRPAREQANDRYAHGGGWQPMPGWQMDAARNLIYPGDPPYRPLMMIPLPSEERVFIYEQAWVAIMQPDGSYEVARMD